AQVAQAAGLRSAAPAPTRTGELSVMVEWPDGVEHPLGLREFVPGVDFDARRPGSPDVLGDIIGRLQPALAAGLRLADRTSPFEYFSYLERDHDLSQFPLLRPAIDAVVAALRDLHQRGELTVAPCVWDGPEARIDADGVLGLYDFGFVMKMPVLHGLANRTMLFDNPSERERFVDR